MDEFCTESSHGSASWYFGQAPAFWQIDKVKEVLLVGRGLDCICKPTHMCEWQLTHGEAETPHTELSCLYYRTILFFQFDFVHKFHCILK